MTWIDQEAPQKREQADSVTIEDLGAQIMDGAGIAPELAVLAKMAEGKRRDLGRLKKEARRHGERLGEAAIYSWKQGGKQISGPTVHLIEALAMEWGYLWTGVRMEATIGQEVHLSGVAVDVLNCTSLTRPYVYTMSAPPGKFAAKPDQAQRWRTMQMQSATSKASRTALEHSLPQWYVASGMEGARAAMAESVNLGNRSVEEAGKEAAKAYRDSFGVELKDLEVWVGAVLALWTTTDLFGLRKLYGALKDGSTTVAAEFSPDGEEVVAPAAPSGLAAIAHTAKESVAEPVEAVEVAADDDDVGQIYESEEVDTGAGGLI